MSTSAVAVCCCRDSRQVVGARAQLAEQACILDGDDRLLREVRNELDLLFGKGLDLLTEDRDGADQFVLPEHRHDDEGARASQVDVRAPYRVALDIGALGHGVLDLNDLPGSHDAAQDVERARLNERFTLAQLGECRRRIVEGHAARHLAFDQPHHSEFGAADARGVFEQFPENRVEIAGRGADDLENFRGRRLLLQRLAEIVGAGPDFPEQPRVFNRDDRLFGEVRDEVDLLVAEKPYLPAGQRDGSNALLVLEHRH